MKSIAPVLILLAVGLGVGFWVWFSPASRPGRGVTAPTVVDGPAPAESAPGRVAEPPVRAIERAAVEDPPTPAVEAEPDATVDAEPGGPFTVDLGEHEILLKERDGRFLRIGLSAVTPHKVTQKEILRRRRHLVRMLFFLGTRRAADAAAQPGAKTRFGSDLVERLRNVVKTGPIDRLEIRTFEVFHRAPADAAPE
jgi:hypothetical protein